MLITKLELYKYKRFFLNDIEKIVYTPMSNTQMVISRNGSGKTSLLKQLNPLPADLKKDFKEDGYKKIEIEHNNKTYICSSGVIKNKHSFIVDNKELNPGGTRTVQIELCKEHFNIDYPIMDILYGISNFTTMSIAERKNWISKMSTIDYTYSIIVYNKLRTRHRDIVGQLRGLKTKLSTISNINTSSIIKEKRNILNNLIALKDNMLMLVGNPITTDYNLDNIVSNITNTVNKIEDINTILNKYNKEDILNKYNKLVEDKNKIDGKLDITIKDIERLDNLLELGDKKEIKIKYNNITTTIDNIVKDLPITITNKSYLDIENIYTILTTIVLPNITSLIIDLDNYKDIRNISTNDKKSILNNKDRLDKLVSMLNKEIEILNNDIDKLKLSSNVIEVDCNKCNNKITYKVEDYYIKEKEVSLSNIVNKLNTISKEYKEISTKANLILEYKDKHYNILDTFTYYKNNYPIVIEYIDYISTNIYNHIDSIDIILNKLTVFTNLIHTVKDLPILLKQQKEYKDKLDILTNTKDNIKNITIELDNKKKLLEELTNNKRDIIKELDFISTIKDKISSIDILKDNLNNLLIDYKNKYTRIINKNKQSIRLKFITKLQELIAEINTELEELVDIDSKRVDIENNIKDLTIREEVLSNVITELSPNSGLIGKSINSFISIFIKDINYIINSIWSYPIKLLECNIDTTDLDYKFKVLINDTEIIEDINRLSSSMQEIVNLAFRIVFYKYMHIDFPLYLDEFGSTFDATHRTVAYNIINTILSSEFKQMFIICHYESLYGSFKNAEFNILDKDNITIPDTLVNKNFNIVYSV